MRQLDGAAVEVQIGRRGRRRRVRCRRGWRSRGRRCCRWGHRLLAAVRQLDGAVEYRIVRWGRRWCGGWPRALPGLQVVGPTVGGLAAGRLPLGRWGAARGLRSQRFGRRRDGGLRGLRDRRLADCIGDGRRGDRLNLEPRPADQDHAADPQHHGLAGCDRPSVDDGRVGLADAAQLQVGAVDDELHLFTADFVVRDHEVGAARTPDDHGLVDHRHARCLIRFADEELEASHGSPHRGAARTRMRSLRRKTRLANAGSLFHDGGAGAPIPGPRPDHKRIA